MPCAVVTRTATVPAVCLGTVTVSFVLETTVTDLPAAVPNRTDRTWANPDPETVIRSPPESGPADWLSRLSTGAVVVADAAGAPTTAQARAASRVADK